MPQGRGNAGLIVDELPGGVGTKLRTEVGGLARLQWRFQQRWITKLHVDFDQDEFAEHELVLISTCNRVELYVASEGAGPWVTAANLAQYQAVMFLMTTGDVLNDEQQAVFEAYVRAGNGFAGLHSATDTEYDWPWYGDLVGAYFKSHPKVQPAAIDVVDRRHPSTAHLAARWHRTDEWYDYAEVPPTGVHRLLELDHDSYAGGRMGSDHPIAWCHEFDGGRAWYTGGGHTSEAFLEPAFRKHLLGGILWAGGRGAKLRPAVE